MRTHAFLLAFLLAPSALAAQGWIVPRPCVAPPPCRGDRCAPVPPCPRPGLGGVERTSSEVRVELIGRVLRYEVSETFVNRGPALGEADYLFPMPKGAAFQDLKLSIDGELVSGETMSSEKARAIYEEIVRRQRDPALVEWMGFGLLRTRIFPINPGEEKKVVVRFQTVTEREGDALRIDYQRAGRSAPGPRPVPMPRPMPVDDAARGDGDEPRESGNSFTLSYERDDELGEPYSPTHRLRTRDRGGRRTITASGDAPQVTILLPVRRATSASMTMLTHAPGREDGFALITITPPSNAPRQTPRDVTFVIDVSGSMRGRKMEQARAAARQFLGTLSPQDRFRLVDFSTDVRAFRDEYVPATAANIRAASRYVDDLRAEGSTNISGALAEALEAGDEASRERMRLVLFLTDGEPTVGERDPNSIAALASRLRRDARVFTFGVGAEANAALMEQLALEGRGTANFVRPEENVERVVSVVAARLTAPLVTDVRVRAEGVRLRQMHPATPVDIFAGQDLVLLARYGGSGEGRLRVEGRTASGPVSWTTTVRFPERERENAFVARLWATQRIGWLAAEKRRTGGSTEIDGEIRELGTQYGIPTEFSSYLVVEPGMRLDNVTVTGTATRDQGLRRGTTQGRAATAPTAAPAEVNAQANAPTREQRFEAAKSAAAQRGAVSLEAADAATVAGGAGTRRVGARMFSLIDGVWVDGRFERAMRTVRVQAYSPAYFALLERVPELRESFALGERVKVAGRRVAVEVAPDGVERLGAAELDALERDW